MGHQQLDLRDPSNVELWVAIGQQDQPVILVAKMSRNDHLEVATQDLMRGGLGQEAGSCIDKQIIFLTGLPKLDLILTTGNRTGHDLGFGYHRRC